MKLRNIILTGLLASNTAIADGKVSLNNPVVNLTNLVVNHDRTTTFILGPQGKAYQHNLFIEDKEYIIRFYDFNESTKLEMREDLVTINNCKLGKVGHRTCDGPMQLYGKFKEGDYVDSMDYENLQNLIKQLHK